MIALQDPPYRAKRSRTYPEIDDLVTLRNAVVDAECREISRRDDERVASRLLSAAEDAVLEARSREAMRNACALRRVALRRYVQADRALIDAQYALRVARERLRLAAAHAEQLKQGRMIAAAATREMFARLGEAS